MGLLIGKVSGDDDDDCDHDNGVVGDTVLTMFLFSSQAGSMRNQISRESGAKVKVQVLLHSYDCRTILVAIAMMMMMMMMM